MALAPKIQISDFEYLMLVGQDFYFIFAIYTNTMLYFPLCLAHCDSGRCWKAEGLSLLLEYKYFDKVFHIVLPDLIWISHVLHMSQGRYVFCYIRK